MAQLVYAWKKAPFLRVLLPFVAGILIQWYTLANLLYIVITAASTAIIYLLLRMLPVALIFRLSFLHGIVMNMFLLAAGAFLTIQNDCRNDPKWFVKKYSAGEQLALQIIEPLIEKDRSYKAEAKVIKVISGDSVYSTAGKLIIYFEKAKVPPRLKYGDIIVTGKGPQEIKNMGNPGGFDYRQYAGFHNIYHSVYLKPKEWVKVEKNKNFSFQGCLFSARQKVLDILRSNIKDREAQLAIAEALLIGYTLDLDKDLVQAYSNTGVVHIIAISGMHLGLIYVMLVWLLNRFPVVNKIKVIKVVIIISALWFFALLTGGSASILRAAVMFTCIIIGENLKRRSSVYNSLAASAFILLCYNPFFLWDAGFQLSYAALSGIVVFQRPLYHLLFFKNRIVDNVWKLIAVTLSAQVFTFPVCLYYFHQFPSLFLFTNILLVPLSGIILFAEIFLVAFAWIPAVALLTGKIAWWLIWLMNAIIIWFNHLPFAVWEGFSPTVFSTVMLYLVIAGISRWLLFKNKTAFKCSLCTLMILAASWSYTSWQAVMQKKIIVYNIPGRSAIEFVDGTHYFFAGDITIAKDAGLSNYYLKPARTFLRLHNADNNVVKEVQKGIYIFNNTRIVIPDSTLIYTSDQKIAVDYMIISKNTKASMLQLTRVFSCRQIIFDASNNLWKIAKWKRDCESLNLPCYSVPRQGAFVLEL